MAKVVERVCVDATDCTNAQWSPDSTRLAYCRNASLSESQWLCVFNTVDQTHMDDLVETDSFAWASDGQGIYAAVYDHKGHVNMCFVSLAGRVKFIYRVDYNLADIVCSMCKRDDNDEQIVTVQASKGFLVLHVNPLTLDVMTVTMQQEKIERSGTSVHTFIASDVASTDMITIHDDRRAAIGRMQINPDTFEGVCWAPNGRVLALCERNTTVVRVVDLDTFSDTRPTRMVYNFSNEDVYIRCKAVGWLRDNLLVVHERVFNGTARIVLLDVSAPKTQELLVVPVCATADITPCVRSDGVFKIATAGECGLQILTLQLC